MTISEERKQDQLTLKVEGRLDTATAPQLERAAEGRLEGLQKLVLDFSNLDYISSAGLRVLLAFRRTMEEQEGTVVVTSVTENVREVFAITGLNKILNIQ